MLEGLVESGTFKGVVSIIAFPPVKQLRVSILEHFSITYRKAKLVHLAGPLFSQKLSETQYQPQLIVGYLGQGPHHRLTPKGTWRIVIMANRKIELAFRYFTAPQVQR